MRWACISAPLIQTKTRRVRVSFSTIPTGLYRPFAEIMNFSMKTFFSPSTPIFTRVACTRIRVSPNVTLHARRNVATKIKRGGGGGGGEIRRVRVVELWRRTDWRGAPKRMSGGIALVVLLIPRSAWAEGHSA